MSQERIIWSIQDLIDALKNYGPDQDVVIERYNGGDNILGQIRIEERDGQVVLI